MGRLEWQRLQGVGKNPIEVLRDERSLLSLEGKEGEGGNKS